MDMHTGWLDAVKGLVSSDALGAGADGCAAINKQLPTSSTVNNNGLQLAGMSSLQTYTRQLSVAETVALHSSPLGLTWLLRYRVIMCRRSRFNVNVT